MKYLIFSVFVLALWGCEKNSPETQDSTKLIAPSEESASEKKLSYLDKPLKSKVSQHGLYKLVRSGGIIDDPNTGTGKAVSNPVVQQVKSTERIPLIKGAQMYLQYRIWPLPDQPRSIKLRRILKHPEIPLPDGSVSTGSDYMIKAKVRVNQAIGYTGYGLDEDYELVEGDWVFEIWYQDKKLVEQKFTTYWPDEEEVASLKSLLAPTKKVGISSPSAEQPFSRRNWPRITAGEKKPSEQTRPLNDSSGQ